jgi:hypothetical protein
MISPNCRGEITKRGICPSCWKHLIQEELITVSGEYPDWLEEMIRIQRNFDEYHEGEESSLTEVLELEIA